MYKAPTGKVANELLYRHDEPRLELVEQGRPWSVDGFWSATVYNDKGFFEAPENAISVNNVTGKRNKDGSMAIHFGGDPKAVNYLRIMPGWNYIVRLYRPQTEIVDGTWSFPEPMPVR